MIRSTFTLACAGLLALVLASPATAAEPAAPASEGEAPAAEPRYATVEIDTSDIGEEGPVIKRRTRERTDVVLRAAGVLPGRSTDDPVIHVDIDELTGDEPGYECQVWISRADVILSERRRVECPLCTESEIVQRVESTVSELVGQLATLVEPAPEAEPAVESKPEPEPLSEPPADDQDRRRLGTLGKAGAALIAVGAAGAGMGVVLVALPPTVDPDDPLYETTYRPPGAAILAGGAAVLVAGVVMLVVDRRRARKPTTALVPMMMVGTGPSTTGLVWSGRF